MIRARKGAYPDTVTPHYSEELISIFNKLSDPGLLKKTYDAVNRIVEKKEVVIKSTDRKKE